MLQLKLNFVIARINRPFAIRHANQEIAWGPELARGPQKVTSYEFKATTNCVVNRVCVCVFVCTLLFILDF